MHSHCINKLLNLEDVIVKKISHADTFVKIYIETKPKEHICPCCGLTTRRIHDYRLQTVKDLPFQMKHCYLVLRKRRYLCPCGKRFFESYSFLPRYFQRTARLTAFIASALHSSSSLKTVSEQANVSTQRLEESLIQLLMDRQNSEKPFLLMNSKVMLPRKNINAYLLIR